MLIIALPLYILDKTGSAALLGTFLAIMIFPKACLSPVIGNFVEKKHKKYLLIYSDFIQGIIFILLYFLIKDLNIYYFGLIMALSLILEVTFDITTASIFSHILEEKYFETGNSWKGMFENIASLIAPVIGIFIYSKLGIEGIFFINAITFIISAVFEIFIKYTHVENSNQNINFKNNMHEVFNYIKSNKSIKKLFLTSIFINLFWGPAGSVVLPYIILKVNMISKIQYGIADSIEILGSILGALLIIYLPKKIKLMKLFNIETILIMLIGIFSIIFINYHNLFFYTYLFLQFLSGVVTLMITVPKTSAFQRNVPKHLQGRFFGVYSFCCGISIPLGNILVGKLFKFVSPQIMIIVLCSLALITTTKLLKDLDDKKIFITKTN